MGKKTINSHDDDLHNEAHLIDIYLKTGFAILLLGERGVGKSRQVDKIKEKFNGKIITANCAEFLEDRMAESRLFGHKKGAFTGATEDFKGLFESANNGVLFLDEIHHLSKEIQARLMLALQTDQNNKVSFSKLGSTEKTTVEFRLMVATNKTLDELREVLLPDFYDRIVQHVIEIPPLRNDLQRIEQHWEHIWKQLKFEEPVPKEKSLINWLKEQKFWGNYRDLQKIAIYYHTYSLFDEKYKSTKTALDYAKCEFGKYGAKMPEQKMETFIFRRGKTAKEMERNFHFELLEWAIKEYGGKKQAAEVLKLSPRALSNWKKEK